MIVTLPHFYNVDHRRDGEIEKKSRAMIGFSEHEIREVSSKDVDVVASWNIIDADRVKQHVECIRNGDKLYLSLIGRDRTPVLAEHLHNARFSSRSNINTVSEFYSGVMTGDDTMHLLYSWNNGQKHKVAKPRGGKITGSTEKKSIARIREMTDNSVIHKGRVYQSVTGLHCEIFTGKNPYGDELTFSDLDYSKNNGKNWHREWEPRGFRWTHSLRISLNDVRYGQRLGNEVVHHQFYNLEINDPAALSYKTEDSFAHKFFQEFVRHSHSSVPSFDRDSAKRWKEIRNIVAESDKTPITFDKLSILANLSEKSIGASNHAFLRDGFKTWEDLQGVITSGYRETLVRKL